MNVYEYLLSYGIKPSVQRIAIMDYLLKHRTHPCIDEIYMALCSEIPTLSKTTVYNTLKLFVEHGAAKMLTIDERNACFDADTTISNARFAVRYTIFSWKRLPAPSSCWKKKDMRLKKPTAITRASVPIVPNPVIRGIN